MARKPSRHTITEVVGKFPKTSNVKMFVGYWEILKNKERYEDVQFRELYWNGAHYEFFINRLENDEEYEQRLVGEEKNRVRRLGQEQQRKEIAIAKKMKQLERLQKQLAKTKV